MPKFGEMEREAIRRKLIEQGRRLFAVYGLKKTGVAELAKAAGIAQGTFYLFYASKEELFFEIMMLEEVRIRAELMEPLQLGGRVTRQEFERFLLASAQVLESDPLIRQLYDPSLMAQLMRKLPEDKLQSNFLEDSKDLMPLIERGQHEGWMEAEQPEVIISLIRSVVLLALQREQIGAERYQPTLQLLVQYIAQGLIKEEAKGND